MFMCVCVCVCDGGGRFDGFLISIPEYETPGQIPINQPVSSFSDSNHHWIESASLRVLMSLYCDAVRMCWFVDSRQVGSIPTRPASYVINLHNPSG